MINFLFSAFTRRRYGRKQRRDFGVFFFCFLLLLTIFLCFSNSVQAQDTIPFVDSGQNLGVANSNAVALGDLDGDGDLDAYVGNGKADSIWLNNGDGFYIDSGQSIRFPTTDGVVNLATLQVILADMDNDGDLDAVLNIGMPLTYATKERLPQFG